MSSGFPELSAQAHLLVAAGDLAAAQELLADALASADPRPAYASSELAEAAGLYARVLVALGEPHSARGWAAFTYSAATRLYGPNDARTVAAAATLAAVLHRVGSYPRAARLYQEVIIELTATDGPESLRVLAAHADLATVEYAQGDCSVARSRMQDAWELHREVYGDGHPGGIKMLARLGSMQRDCGRFTEAHENLALARDLCRRHLATDDSLAVQVTALARAAANPDHLCAPPTGHGEDTDTHEPVAVPSPEETYQTGTPTWSDTEQPTWSDTGWQETVGQSSWQASDGRSERYGTNDAYAWQNPTHHRDWGQAAAGSGWDGAVAHHGQEPVAGHPQTEAGHPERAWWDGYEQTGGRPPPEPYASPLPPGVALATGTTTDRDGGAAPGQDWRAVGAYVYSAGPDGDTDDPDHGRRRPPLPERRGNRLPVRVPHPHRRRGSRATPLVVAGVVVVLLGAAAVVVGVTAMDRSDPTTPLPEPSTVSAGVGTPTPVNGAPTVRGAAPGGLPPAGVALRDNGETVTLTWRYPEGADGPVVVSGGRKGQQAWAIEQLPARTGAYEVRGLGRSYDYCFTVAVVYSVDTVSRADPVCTGRR